MSTSTPNIAQAPVTLDVVPGDKAPKASGTAKTALTSRWSTLVAIVLAVLWTIPTFGLLLTSFRTQTDINRDGWWNAFLHPNFTLDNYTTVFDGSTTVKFTDYIVNSIAITLPAVFLPILLASLAAYAFAWMRWPGRDVAFVVVFALQIVPIQVTLIPLLSGFVDLGLNGSFVAVWLSHTVFALPLAIFLLHNFMREIPAELMEAARVDGAGHTRIFFQVLMPLITPALAAFGIFQFLWVWNDLLVSLVFLSGNPDAVPLTVLISDLSGNRGQQWYLLSAGAFIAIIIPLVVFLSLQRFFVRGLLAGGLKG